MNSVDPIGFIIGIFNFVLELAGDLVFGWTWRF